MQKNWFAVQAPDIFDKEEVSETPAEKASQVEGRTIKEGLNEMMDDTSKYYMDVTLKITEVEGNKAFTEISETQRLKLFPILLCVSVDSVVDNIQTASAHWNLSQQLFPMLGTFIFIKLPASDPRCAAYALARER